MKRGLILLFLLCLLGSAAAEDRLPPRYPLSETGEAMVNDITFFPGFDTEDNARVFYEIFVGSFSDSNGDGIGDLRGIINRLDYLNDGDPASGMSLGVEGLWLTPVFFSPTYHKYDVTDYYTVDPSFGTNEDLRELIRKCHDRGMLVILDLPINHTGKANVWFSNFLSAHICNNPNNIWYDFYTWIGPDESAPARRTFTPDRKAGLKYESNFSDSMPELNYDNPLVRQKMLDVAMYWLEQGADGFRFDAAKYIYFGSHEASAAFWDEYLTALRKVKPDLYTVGEVWDSDGITDLYAGSLNCFNFTTSQVNGLISETAQAGDANRWAAYLQNRLETLHSLNPDAMNIPFIANHDTDRAAGYLPVTNGRAVTAACLYLLSPGSPFIYYGEEIGLRGSRGGAATDANRRLAMRWGDGDTVQDPIGTTYDPAKQTSATVAELSGSSTGLYTQYKRLLMLRKANPEIARGSLKALRIPDSKMGGYTCTWNGSSVTVLHNTTGHTLTVDLKTVDGAVCNTVSGFAGLGTASLSDGVLTLDAQTSVILR